MKIASILLTNLLPWLNHDPWFNWRQRIKTYIKKHQHKWVLKHFFNAPDINKHVKYWIHLAGPLKVLLYGCKAWNLSKKRVKLHAFHHSAIHQILGIHWGEMKEQCITIEMIRALKTCPPLMPSLPKESGNTSAKPSTINILKHDKKTSVCLDSQINCSPEKQPPSKIHQMQLPRCTSWSTPQPSWRWNSERMAPTG